MVGLAVDDRRRRRWMAMTMLAPAPPLSFAFALRRLCRPACFAAAACNSMKSNRRNLPFAQHSSFFLLSLVLLLSSFPSLSARLSDLMSWSRIVSLRSVRTRWDAMDRQPKTTSGRGRGRGRGRGDGRGRTLRADAGKPKPNNQPTSQRPEPTQGRNATLAQADCTYYWMDRLPDGRGEVLFVWKTGWGRGVHAHLSLVSHHLLVRMNR
ncbi:hypothetical protein IWX90DRAFT_266350 [Phyllosticta citrichinensis]|uniref:Uncharacterized protein n=1 Tax=Phyllosticta citrichinensis TaxID=1130410 RepID=A0ABR1XMD2_9PEZI